MNRIQMISRDIETRRLKLQMGLGPDLEIDHSALRSMWRALSLEQLRDHLRQKFAGAAFDDLPADPRFLAGD